MQKKEIVNSLTEACRYITKYFLPGARLAGVFLSKRRKKPLAFYYWHGDKLYCITFKRDFFRQFSKLFEGQQGKGQSMNVDLLNQAIARGKASGGCEMVVVMPNGDVYSYDAEAWLKYAVGNRTIRRTMDEASVEASIPVSIMKKWDKPMPEAVTPPELAKLERLTTSEGKQAKLTTFAKEE